MNYIKSIWTSNPATTSNENIQQQQQSTNSVTFTSGNSFVITSGQTPQQRPQQLIFHTNSSSLRSEMTVSPSDSFHSTSSSFEHEKGPTKEKKKKGNVNNGYTGSASDVNNIQHMQPHRHNQVVREQYWTWQWPFTPFWDSWNNREKIFLIVIVVLSLCCLILLSILSVVLTRYMQLKEIILSKLGNDGVSLL